MSEKTFWTARDISVATGRHESTIRRMLAAGKLHSTYRVGTVHCFNAEDYAAAVAVANVRKERDRKKK